MTESKTPTSFSSVVTVKALLMAVARPSCPHTVQKLPPHHQLDIDWWTEFLCRPGRV